MLFPKKGAGGLIGFPYSQHRWWYKDETWEEDWKEDGTYSGMVRQGQWECEDLDLNGHFTRNK